MQPEEIIERIRQVIPDAEVELTDLTGTKDHWQARIVSSHFEGKNLIARHRLVFSALEAEMKGPIHALTLEVLTPAQSGK